MEDNLMKLMMGQHLGEITPELCDFSIAEQNAVTEAQGIQPNTVSDFIPVLGKSVTYIVACVLINDMNEILMIQESKQSCAGKWYLPAGRIEKNETISEAAIREVFEETGLNVELTTLLAVEVAGGTWFRFVLTGRVIGGVLKTLDQSDEESLQAKWIGNLDDMNLRARDIIPLIDIARYYHNRNNLNPWHRDIMSVQFSHHRNFLRIVAVIRKRATNTINILLSEKNVHHFPTVEIRPSRSVHSTLRKFMIELFGADLPQHRPHGILSVEYQPNNSNDEELCRDGLCLTLLVVFRPPMEEVALIGKCVWHEITNKVLEKKIDTILSNRNSTIQLHVIR